jgi:RNA polymerase sigma factor (sigma-70 family)
MSANEPDWLARRFQQDRDRLRAVAYRMLGSLAEADDAVQETWLRLSRSGAADVDNLTGWLTTVTGRVCLDMLRSRAARREEPLDARLPDPVVSSDLGTDPERQALLADAVGLALQIVLQQLAPAERLAFVLHDMFAVPFDQIAAILDRSPNAARLLASRARRRVQTTAAVPDADPASQRHAVDAFFAASRAGDLDALVALLDPDVVARADLGAKPAGTSRQIRGARAVAEQAVMFSRLAPSARRALINGAAGAVVAQNGKAIKIIAFTVSNGKITEIDILADPSRLRQLDHYIVGSRSNPADGADQSS